MKGFNRNRETRLRTSNKQYGRRDEEESHPKGMLNPDTADRYWRCNKRKNLTALRKDSRQNKKPHGKKKRLTAEETTSRQTKYQCPHGIKESV